MFWSSQSPKVLRGLNFFCDFEAKTLGGPTRLKRLNLLEVLGDCTPNQKDGGLSALWDWELQNTERPQSFGILDLNKIEASQCFGALRVSKC